MRYSPYCLSDYGLQHAGGSVVPISMLTYDEAAWNLYWAALPELDLYLDLQYEDFTGFRALTATFPFARKGSLSAMLDASPGLYTALRVGPPAEAAAYLRTMSAGLIQPDLLTPTLARLEMAQQLIEMKEAQALCKSVVAVDFRAGRRL